MTAYATGLIPHLHLLTPTGQRVKLKPIFQKTKFAVPDSQLSSLLVCYEVEKVGPLVKELRPGMHVLHIAAAGDSADFKDLVICHEDEVICWWYPPD